MINAEFEHFSNSSAGILTTKVDPHTVRVNSDLFTREILYITSDYVPKLLQTCTGITCNLY